MAGEKLPNAHQENLLTLLAHDDTHGKLIAQMVNPDLFEGDYREVAERLIKYWKKYKKAPKVHTADLFSDILDDDKNRRRRTFERILRNMDTLFAGPINTEYIMNSVRDLTRESTIKDAILKAAEVMNARHETSVEETEVLLANVLRARTLNFDPGIKLIDVGPIIDYLDSHSSEFRVGIGPLDRGNIVPSRGTVFLWLAPPGKGKSWALVHTGKHGLLQRKRVLHITLEMSAEETAQRYYQSLFSVPKRRGPVEITEMIFDKKQEARLRKIGSTIEVMPEFAMEDGKIRSLLMSELKPFKNIISNLIIKRFPTRGLTIDTLRAYLDALEASQGFMPDMIILDYIGIMQTDAKNHRISLGRVMEEFRGLCVERSAAAVTASQISRVGAKADLVRATHAAEDYSLIATADVAITYTQSDAEKQYGLARLFVDKARTERDKFAMVITQAYPIGQFALQAARLNRVYSAFYSKLPKDVHEDDIEE